MQCKFSKSLIHHKGNILLNAIAVDAVPRMFSVCGVTAQFSFLCLFCFSVPSFNSPRCSVLSWHFVSKLYQERKGIRKKYYSTMSYSTLSATVLCQGLREVFYNNLSFGIHFVIVLQVNFVRVQRTLLFFVRLCIFFHCIF